MTAPPRPPSVAALLVAASVLLSGCGGRFTPPAATVDGVEIPEATLERRLDAVLADPTLAARLTGPDALQRRRDLTREMLGFLIRMQVIEAEARARGVTVSETDIDGRVEEITARLGGPEAFAEELRRRGLTLQDVRENVRESLVSEEVRLAVARERLGTDVPSPEEAERAFVEWLQARLRAAEIEVNPRFGAFDPEAGTVCRIASTAGDLACPQAL